MKVLSYTTSYLAVLLLILISIWAGVFYYAMLDEIYDSIDDGLDNQKGLIMQKVITDSSILHKSNFDESDYAITPIAPLAAQQFNDVYIDTSMYMQNEKDFEPVRLLKSVFRHGDKYYHLQVATSMVEEDDLLAELLYAMLWLYLGLVASLLIVNNLLLKKIWAPFYYLLKQLRNFNLERPSRLSMRHTNIDEFKLLNEAVQVLLQNNMDAYNGQKHFVENAAHELQTPLAICINKLEALAETSQFSRQQLALLADALQNLERLTRLNKSLLLLFRIENKLFHETAPVHMNQLATRIADDFRDQLSYNQVTLQLEEQDTAIVQLNPDLAAILVTNLIKNAMLHNITGGYVKLLISKQSLSVENTGTGKPLDAQMLFSRFNSQSASDNSTGLGLAIVKAIADLYHFKVTYTHLGTHIFTIHFN